MQKAEALDTTDMAKDNRTLLLVDDEVKVINSLKRVLRDQPMEIISAHSGIQAMELIKSHHVSVVLSDQKMPQMDGITFLEKVKIHDPDIVRLMLTAHADLNNAIEAINRSQIFEFLTKPWDADTLVSALTRAFNHYQLVKENRHLQLVTHDQNNQLRQLNHTLEKRVQERTLQLEDAVREGILMLALAAEAKDDSTGDHVRRIEKLTKAICLQLGIAEENAGQIAFFSMMHDVGKIHIPDSILKKPGPLIKGKEWQIMKSHTIAGEKILGNKPFYKIARQIARSHHEWFDGQGYPDGLKGEAIPLSARIVTVADVFDALTHKRSYKPAWSKSKTLEEMQRFSGRQFDPVVMEAFFQIIDNYPDDDLENCVGS